MWWGAPALVGFGSVDGGGGDGGLSVSDGGVQGDDVLEVEQVGVLRPGHEGSGWVEEFARGPVTVGQYGQKAPYAQQAGGEQGHVITGAGAVVVGMHAGDDEIGVCGGGVQVDRRGVRDAAGARVGPRGVGVVRGAAEQIGTQRL